MIDKRTALKTTQFSNPSEWVELYGDFLYRYALPRLRDPLLAQEAIQETFLAALKARDSFQGRSSERSWLVGILKHKIIDHFRRVSRERPVEDVEPFTKAERQIYDEHGRVRPELGPKDWGRNPYSSLEEKEFHRVIQKCLDNLPTRIAEAFVLREMEGLETQQLCKVLNISSTNLWVMLHRARMQLRECLEANWFVRSREKA